jgi:hypothetical protein
VKPLRGWVGRTNGSLFRARATRQPPMLHIPLVLTMSVGEILEIAYRTRLSIFNSQPSLAEDQLNIALPKQLPISPCKSRPTARRSILLGPSMKRGRLYGVRSCTPQRINHDAEGSPSCHVKTTKLTHPHRIHGLSAGPNCAEASYSTHNMDCKLRHHSDLISVHLSKSLLFCATSFTTRRCTDTFCP